MIVRQTLVMILVVFLFSCSNKDEQAASNTTPAASPTPMQTPAEQQSESTAPADVGDQSQESTAPNPEQEVAADAASDATPGMTADAAAATESATPGGESEGSGDMAPDPNLELARASGCLACHAVDKKVVGPAWMAVAQRYKGDAKKRDQLIAKVKAGGRGNWTDVVGNVAMPPYSPRVSDENIAKLIDFVLGLAP